MPKSQSFGPSRSLRDFQSLARSPSTVKLGCSLNEVGSMCPQHPKFAKLRALKAWCERCARKVTRLQICYEQPGVVARQPNLCKMCVLLKHGVNEACNFTKFAKLVCSQSTV